MSTALPDQARRLYEVFAELLREYQFRDRESICCHGLSVTQCYVLDLIDRSGPMPVGELASRLHLDISSMSRVVDHLVKECLAERVPDPNDRRVCRVRIVRRGRSRVARIRKDIVGEYETILGHIPRDSRESVIQAITEMLAAFKSGRACRSRRVRASCRG